MNGHLASEIQAVEPINILPVGLDEFNEIGESLSFYSPLPLLCEIVHPRQQRTHFAV